MSPINKQRFLTELGRLLTFMYEEDRVRALEMYEDIFDAVNNDTAVLQLLVSPTRQAVNLARAYDARERKYQQDGEEPAYQLVIEDLRREALTLAPAAPKLEDEQISLFNDTEAVDNVFADLGLDVPPEKQENSGADNSTDSGNVPHQYALFPDEDRGDEPMPLTPPPAAPVEQTEPPKKEDPAREVEDFSDAVDAFLADFTIKDELSGQKEPAVVPEPVSSIQDEDTFELPPQPAPVKEEAPAFKVPEPPPAQVTEPTRKSAQRPERSERPHVSVSNLPDMTGTVERRANVPLLVLFIVLAVPVGLACLAVILPLAGMCLSLAAAALYVGVSGVIAAFGFSVFADILLVFGLSLSLAALGLLLLWVFVWLLAGAIPGVVRGICKLGRKLCYKEVSA